MSGEPSSPAPTNAGPASAGMSGMQHVYAIIGAQGFGAALLGGGLSMFVLGASPQRAVQIGAMCSLSTSLADAIEHIGGFEKTVATYSEKYITYIDPADVIVGGAVGGALFWYMGASGQELMYSAGIAGASAAFGAKLSSGIIDTISGVNAV